jgi:hypothetical protein
MANDDLDWQIRSGEQFEDFAGFAAKSAISMGRWLIRSRLPSVPLKKKKVRY